MVWRNVTCMNGKLQKKLYLQVICKNGIVKHKINDKMRYQEERIKF